MRKLASIVTIREVKDIPWSDTLSVASMQGKGWQDWVYNYETAGTFGESRRIEGFKIKLEGLPSEVSEHHCRELHTVSRLVDAVVHVLPKGDRVHDHGDDPVHIIVGLPDEMLCPGGDEVLPGAGRQADGGQKEKSFHISTSFSCT